MMSKDVGDGPHASHQPEIADFMSDDGDNDIAVPEKSIVVPEKCSKEGDDGGDDSVMQQKFRRSLRGLRRQETLLASHVLCESAI